MSRKYVYGVIEAGERVDFGPLGIGGAEVNAVPCLGLACLVSDYSGQDYSTAARSSLTREQRGQVLRDLTAHQAVYERVMKQHSVLPVKFGTVVDSEDDLHRLLEQGYSRFSDALAQIEGKVEFDVAATWDLDRVLQEISGDSGFAQLNGGPPDGPKKVTREEGILAGMQVDDALNRRRDDCRGRMVGHLNKLALDLQESALPSDDLVMNVALLVHAAQEGDLDRRVEQLNALFNDEINFRIIGPLPPCSFSTVEVRRPSVPELEEARKLLGVGIEVCEDDVREAYRNLIAVSHPDVNPDDPHAGDKVDGLRRAAALLTEFCRDQGAGKRETGRATFSLSPEIVADTFLISINRATMPMG